MAAVRILLTALAVLVFFAPCSAETSPDSRPNTSAVSAPGTHPTIIPAAFAGPPTGFPRDAKTGALNKVPLAGVKNDAAWFHLAVPPNYTPDQAYPLVLILHGGPAGNGPDDIISFFRRGLMAKNVISAYPNALEKQLLAWNYPDHSAYLLAIIKQVAATYRVDPCRIYLVGVSMGGGGVWANGAIMPQVWAGIGPISGWYHPTPIPPTEGLKDLPIYCLHGEKDADVPAARSRLAVAELTKLGHTILTLKDPTNLKGVGKETMVYREIPNAEHNVFLPWDTQGRTELGLMIAWLTAHKRSQPADLDAAARSLAIWGKESFHWTYDGLLGTYDK